MEENPYNKILDIMTNSAEAVVPASYRIGIVIKDDPLEVDIGGAIQKRKNLVIAEYPYPVTVFVSGAHSHSDPDAPGNEEVCCPICPIEPNAPHAHTGIVDWPPKYKKGDKLLLIPIEDEQRYIVMAKLRDL